MSYFIFEAGYWLKSFVWSEANFHEMKLSLANNWKYVSSVTYCEGVTTLICGKN